MASSYRVNLLDVLRTQANSEQENRKRVLRVYGGLMALTHLLDVCAAVALVACYGGFEAKAALRPFERWDFAFGHKITDVFFMALARAIVFPLLTRLAVRCGRRDGCLCTKKNTAAPEGYAALEGEERTGAAAAASEASPVPLVPMHVWILSSDVSSAFRMTCRSFTVTCSASRG